ncbi:MAG: hypothetical protein KJ011_18710 [Burkholderiaceae bacterium]|nr:hypothetical protein [Burkholderiaceae bacterium]
MATSPIDRDGPPDGDFASYVEQLSGNAGRAPGRVESSGKAAGGRPRAGTRTAQPAASSPPSSGNLALEARNVSSRAAGGADQAADALRAAGRSVALRLSRWFAIGGIVLIAAAVLDLFPALSPLPGFALLMLSLVLRRLSTR